MYRLMKNNNDKSTAYGKYFAKAVMTETTNLKTLADRIQRNCTAKRSDVLAVLTELVEVMQDELQASHRVKLDGFGSFKIGISGDSVEDPKKYSVTENVKSLHVNFSPEVTIDAGNKKHMKTFLTGCRIQEIPKSTTLPDDNTEGGEGTENP